MINKSLFCSVMFLHSADRCWCTEIMVFLMEKLNHLTDILRYIQGSEWKNKFES